jgi:hypothetical protein
MKKISTFIIPMSLQKKSTYPKAKSLGQKDNIQKVMKK